MTAYNKLNGTYCSQNAWLLQTVLREEWGFDGAVISDWGAVSGVAESIAAGLDLCMPGPRPDYAPTALAAVRRGALEERCVDRRRRARDRSCGAHAPAAPPSSLLLVRNDRWRPCGGRVGLQEERPPRCPRRA